MAQLENRIKELEETQAQADFWNDPKKAQLIIREYNVKKDLLTKYRLNENALNDTSATLDELSRDYDPELFDLVNEEYQEVQDGYNYTEYSGDTYINAVILKYLSIG